MRTSPRWAAVNSQKIPVKSVHPSRFWPITASSRLNRLIYATHGHVYNTAYLPPLCPGDILLHGHTHVPAWEPFGEENLYLNPGSVSIPKNGSARGYLTLEDGVFQWKTLSGDVYHTLTL